MSPTRQLRLSPHVRACRCDGQVILLDLARGRYVAVSGRVHQALGHAVEGWPLDPTGPADPIEPGDAARLAAPLVRQGLLTSMGIARQSQLTLPQAAASVVAEDWIHVASLGPARILRICRSALGASLQLRHQSLLTIAERLIADRRAMVLHDHGPDIETLGSVMGAYAKLRPLLFTAHERCLQDSLSIVRLLALEGIAASWVIGVRTGPFAAHAWAQRGEVVLGDLHEQVRRFVPILCV